MKKNMFITMAFAAMSFVSCGNKSAANAEGADSAAQEEVDAAKAKVQEKVDETKAKAQEQVKAAQDKAKEKANEAINNAAKDLKKGLGL